MVVKFNLITDEITTNDFIGIMNQYLHFVDKKKIEINKCEIEDIKPEQNYFYLIKQEKVRYKYSIIESKYIDLVNKTNNFFIGFFTEHESIDEADFRDILKFTRDNNIDENKILILNNSSVLDEYKEKYKSNLNVYKLNFLSFIKMYDMFKGGEFEYNKEKKGKFFMSFNKTVKRHRVGLLSYLKHENLLNDVNWSYVPSNNPMGIENDNFFKPIMGDEEINDLKNEINYFRNLKYKYSDYEQDEIEEYSYEKSIKLTMVENPKNYTNSYVNLTTESNFDERENVIHITEKTFKPFYYYQIPLIMGGYRQLEKTKKIYDVDLFDDVLDLSYDKEKNHIIRFKKYINEVKRVYLKKNEIIEFYQNNQERFESNKKKMISSFNFYENDLNYFYNFIWKKPLI